MKRKPPEVDVLPKEKRGRRIQLKTLDDAAREHRHIYNAMVNGKMSLEAGDILSRVVGRHKEILAVIEQQRQLDGLIGEMQRLNGEKAIAFDPDLVE